MKKKIVETEIDYLVTMVGSSKSQVAAKGRQHLMEMGGEGIEALLRVAVIESQDKARRKKLVIVAMTGWVIALALMGAYTKIPIRALGGVITSIIAMGAASDRHKSAAKALAMFDDKRAIGALIDVLEEKDDATVKVASQALVKLLPQLQASDFNLISANQRTILNRMLLKKDMDLIVAILRAYKQVGDATAVPVVQKLADGAGKAKRDSRLAEAIAACMPLLQERAKENEARQHLLRAAETDESQSASLLRAASNGTEDHSEQLLRPANSASAPSTAHYNHEESDAAALHIVRP